MKIRGIGAPEQFFKSLITHRKCDRKTYGPPEGEPAAHPVFKAENIFRGNAKLLYRLQVGGNGDEMFCNMFFPARTGEEPGPGLFSVRPRFLGSESF